MKKSDIRYIVGIVLQPNESGYWLLTLDSGKEPEMIEVSNMNKYIKNNNCYIANATISPSGLALFTSKADKNSYMTTNSSGYALGFPAIKQRSKLHVGNLTKDGNLGSNFIVIDKNDTTVTILNRDGRTAVRPISSLIKWANEGLLYSNAEIVGNDIKLLHKGLSELLDKEPVVEPKAEENIVPVVESKVEENIEPVVEPTVEQSNDSIADELTDKDITFESAKTENIDDMSGFNIELDNTEDEAKTEYNSTAENKPESNFGSTEEGLDKEELSIDNVSGITNNVTNSSASMEQQPIIESRTIVSETKIEETHEVTSVHEEEPKIGEDIYIPRKTSLMTVTEQLRINKDTKFNIYIDLNKVCNTFKRSPYKVKFLTEADHKIAYFEIEGSIDSASVQYGEMVEPDLLDLYRELGVPTYNFCYNNASVIFTFNDEVVDLLDLNIIYSMYMPFRGMLIDRITKDTNLFQRTGIAAHCHKDSTNIRVSYYMLSSSANIIYLPNYYVTINGYGKADVTELDTLQGIFNFRNNFSIDRSGILYALCEALEFCEDYSLSDRKDDNKQILIRPHPNFKPKELVLNTSTDVAAHKRAGIFFVYCQTGGYLNQNCSHASFSSSSYTLKYDAYLNSFHIDLSMLNFTKFTNIPANLIALGARTDMKCTEIINSAGMQIEEKCRMHIYISLPENVQTINKDGIKGIFYPVDRDKGSNYVSLVDINVDNVKQVDNFRSEAIHNMAIIKNVGSNASIQALRAPNYNGGFDRYAFSFNMDSITNLQKVTVETANMPLVDTEYVKNENTKVPKDLQQYLKCFDTCKFVGIGTQNTKTKTIQIIDTNAAKNIYVDSTVRTFLYAYLRQSGYDNYVFCANRNIDNIFIAPGVESVTIIANGGADVKIGGLFLPPGVVDFKLAGKHTMVQTMYTSSYHYSIDIDTLYIPATFTDLETGSKDGVYIHKIVKYDDALISKDTANAFDMAATLAKAAGVAGTIETVITMDKIKQTWTAILPNLFN